MRIAKYQIEIRKDTGFLSQTIAILAALLAATGISALLILSSGADVGLGFEISLYRGAFGDGAALLETLVQSTPLIFTGLAMMLPSVPGSGTLVLKAMFFAGAMAATWISPQSFQPAQTGFADRGDTGINCWRARCGRLFQQF